MYACMKCYKYMYVRMYVYTYVWQQYVASATQGGPPSPLKLGPIDAATAIPQRLAARHDVSGAVGETEWGCAFY